MPKQTIILRLRGDRLGARPTGRILRVLECGGILVYPTETFYALGAPADSEAGTGEIYRLKERDRGKPLPVAVADLPMARACADAPAAPFEELAREFWPGPLTLIVKARPGFPAAVLGPGGSIALRVPGRAWLRSLLARFGRPLTATSANISGQGEISRGDEAVRQFRGKVGLIVDGGKTPGGLPSTIVDLSASPPLVVRAGAVPADALAPFLAGR